MEIKPNQRCLIVPWAISSDPIGSRYPGTVVITIQCMGEYQACNLARDVYWEVETYDRMRINAARNVLIPIPPDEDSLTTDRTTPAPKEVEHV